MRLQSAFDSTEPVTGRIPGAHYRFGARTAASNLMIGMIFVILAIVLGNDSLAVIYLLPLSVLGILLVFAGGQLAMTIMDLENRKDFFVVLLMLGITFASNLAAGFMVGIAVAWVLKAEKLQVSLCFGDLEVVGY